MMVSKITNKELAAYLRLEYEDLLEAEKSELDVFLGVAKAFIRSYTGLNDSEIDEHEDFVIVVYVLCQDMFDNRVLYVDKNNLNKVVSTILDMHCVNLI